VRIHTYTLKTGITRTPEFERKGLCSFAVNTGTKCGHDCRYCSTGALLRMHRSFKLAGESPFASGFAIVDATTPERVARDARGLRQRGLIQLCTTVDAWAPEAQQHSLGRRCLEAILAEADWQVRILTKNAAVEHDFDLIQRHKERVLVGLSLTAPPDKGVVIRAVEPNASPIAARMTAMEQAHRLGLRTYAMFCPLLPGIADNLASVRQLVEFGLDCGVEEVFVEPVNGRGPGLKATEAALREAGFMPEADAVAQIRHKPGWSSYVARLLDNVQSALRRFGALDKLRFLLYPSRLTDQDRRWIQDHGQGVRWLGNNEEPAAVNHIGCGHGASDRPKLVTLPGAEQ
jgi:DNA repair photolyase